jgi:hypothetical protein
MSKKKEDMFAWNDAIRKMNAGVTSPVYTNRWAYLRGVNGVVVHVFPTNYLKFSVKLQGKMGWSEGLFEVEDGERWGGSGTFKIFNTFDEALDVGIERVEEILNEQKEDRYDKS